MTTQRNAGTRRSQEELPAGSRPLEIVRIVSDHRDVSCLVRDQRPRLGAPTLPTLFSYVVRWDAGSAPNPFWGVCTLAICKPQIRRSARAGDWVIGFASGGAPLSRAGNRIVYAMRVTESMPWPVYDALCRSRLERKIPDMTSPDLRLQRGDCQYDCRTDPPTQRPGVHGPDARGKDLGGPVLLSEHFRYYGANARLLPASLREIAPHGRGFRSRRNAPFVDRFVAWFERLADPLNEPLGRPIGWPPAAAPARRRGRRC